MAVTAARNPVEMRMALNAPLTPIERTVLALVDEAAEAGLPAPSIETLTEAIGATGVSTVPGIMNRLEAKGYMTRTIYQRGRQICITATGKCTAPPPCLVPHWRTNPDRAPSPAIQVVREQAKPLAVQIEAEARMLGMAIPDFLAELVKRGWHEYLVEKEAM